MLRVRQSALSDFKGGKGRSPSGFGGDLRVRIHISSPGRNPDLNLGLCFQDSEEVQIFSWKGNVWVKCTYECFTIH